MNNPLDPDLTYSEEDSNIKEKRDRFVKDANNQAPVVNLFGVITHELSTLAAPILSGVDIMLRFHRNNSGTVHKLRLQFFTIFDHLPT